MIAWIQREEEDKGISFLRKEAEPNRGKTEHQWIMKYIFVCARMGTGGKSKYVPKHPERTRKIPNKRLDCSARIVGKSYPARTTILGRYEASHSHPIGGANLIFTRIPPAVRQRIEEDLRAGIRPDVVLARARGNAKSSLTAPLADSLRDLDTTLTAVSTGAEILPRRVKVAPNRGTWNDTAEVMGVKKKGAKKRKHLDAYAGGQASGKSARNDARTAKKARVADPAMEMPEETLSDEAPLGFEEGFFSDLATPDGGLDQWPVGEPVASEPPEAAQKSPETLLRETFAIYNAMFPPNVPQQTSYYRNNSYPVVTPGSYYRTR
ncbi:hypothetical protein R3P38DRAFT_3362725 [Favolaschia claudopus]|uniref:Uncharacterized protein n=1 Tax=Favolaschia claudopus TaxID=2862362 RepID=A0AAW0AL34_9AGAR